jgi:hypothetical protein
MVMQGFIYALLNSSMPGLVKIGYTTRTLDERIAELSRPSGVPTPFELLHSVPVTDCVKAEALVHAALLDSRVHDEREFFRVSSQQAVRALDDVARMLAPPPTPAARPHGNGFGSSGTTTSPRDASARFGTFAQPAARSSGMSVWDAIQRDQREVQEWLAREAADRARAPQASGDQRQPSASARTVSGAGARGGRGHAPGQQQHATPKGRAIAAVVLALLALVALAVLLL